ncbi:D-alanyl-D-alanine carboxypeptidase PBP3 [Streptococcus uberis]
MKKMLLLCFIFLILFPINFVNADSTEDFHVKAKSAIAFDVSTGKVLYQKNEKEVLPVASLSKVLTTYLVYKEVKSGKLSWDTPVTISNYPYELTTNYSISNVPLDARQYTVKELLNAVLITNANSAAIALAEKISGNEPRFVDLMTKQLKEWGIKDAKLVNATGLSNAILGDHIYPHSTSDDENQMSALDLAIVSNHLLSEFPEVVKQTQKASATFSNQKIFSYNYMLKGMPNYRDGVNGLFVAYSEKSGASFLASSTENNMSVVTVVLNAEQSNEEELGHFRETNTLLNYISNHFEPVILLEKGKKVPKTKLNLLDGKQKSVNLIAKKNLIGIRKIGSQDGDSVTIDYKNKRTFAPVKRNEALARASFNDKEIIGTGYLDKTPTISLGAAKDVQKSFFLKVWWNHFVNYVNTKL